MEDERIARTGRVFGAITVVLAVVLGACAAPDVEPSAVRTRPTPHEPDAAGADEPLPLFEALRRPRRGTSPYDAGGLILQLWPSGRAVWSDDPRRALPPYWEGELDDETLADLIDELESCMDGASAMTYVIPDSNVMESTLRVDGVRVARTSHVLFETNEKLVARESGVGSLRDGETREEVRARESEAFRAFVEGWDCLFDVHARAAAAATDVVPLDQETFELRPR